jgi:hypothetical protein
MVKAEQQAMRTVYKLLDKDGVRIWLHRGYDFFLAILFRKHRLKKRKGRIRRNDNIKNVCCIVNCII